MKKIGLWIKGLWGLLMIGLGLQKDGDKIREIADATLKVIAVIRKIIENPTLDLITELTATRLDDHLLAIFREVLQEMNESLKDYAVPKNAPPTATVFHYTKPASLPDLENEILIRAIRKEGIAITESEAIDLLIQAKKQANRSDSNA